MQAIFAQLNNKCNVWWFAQGIVLILGSTGEIKPGEHRVSILSTKER